MQFFLEITGNAGEEFCDKISLNSLLQNEDSLENAI